ncbi:hypothetical protein [uncultured Tenacibaculum sp.]|uniref:hypothetical protein n=1 Tax=uncultured Tenacibaculum sp. TaxID=174713 RepID=UPI00263310D0|nr:hypothetical protein [uncultured Tenacibaculum sp.]
MKKVNFEVKRVLKKDELKSITGGLVPQFFARGNCSAICGDGTKVSCSGGGCSAVDTIGSAKGFCEASSNGKKVKKTCKS